MERALEVFDGLLEVWAAQRFSPSVGVDVSVGGPVGSGLGQKRQVELVAWRQRDRAFARVLQLSDIAGPGVAIESVEQGRRHLEWTNAEARRALAEEVARQRMNGLSVRLEAVTSASAMRSLPVPESCRGALQSATASIATR
jgi:hypothetical protein